MAVTAVVRRGKVMIGEKREGWEAAPLQAVLQKGQRGSTPEL